MLSRIFIWIIYFSCMKAAVRAEPCGSLNFTQATVSIGETTDLVFTPTHHMDSTRRSWVLVRHSATPLTVYSTNTGVIRDNFNEIQSQTQSVRILQISNVSNDIIGKYLLRIFDAHEQLYCDSGYAYLSVKPLSVTDCGQLFIFKPTISAGEHASFTFNGNGLTSTDLVWQRDIGNGYETIATGGRFDTRSVQDTRAYLFISDAIVTDSGKYRVQCQNRNSNVQRLDVVPTSPSKPVFKNVKTIHTCSNCIAAYKDVETTIYCSSENGSKPITLAMYKNGSPVGDTRAEQNRKLVVEYKFTPTYSDIKANLTCTVINDVLTVPLKTDVQLYIYIVPEKVNVAVPDVIKEGEEQSIVCSTFKGRPPVKPDFLFNYNELNTTMRRDITPTGDTFTVKATIRKTFTRQDNQDSVVCGLLKKHLKSSIDEKTVNVLFPPLSANLLENSKTNEPNGDTKLELKLAVGASNPLSEVKWQGLDNVMAEHTNYYLNESVTKGQSLLVDLSMDLTRADNNREIKAIVTNKMFPQMRLSTSFMINITYAPVIKIGNGLVTKIVFVGDDVVLTCNVDSNPRSNVTWYNDTGLMKEGYRTEILDLHLLNVTTDEAQMYTCVAENQQGTSNVSLLIVVKDGLNFVANNDISNEAAVDAGNDHDKILPTNPVKKRCHTESDKLTQTKKRTKLEELQHWQTLYFKGQVENQALQKQILEVQLRMLKASEEKQVNLSIQEILNCQFLEQ